MPYVERLLDLDLIDLAKQVKKGLTLDRMEECRLEALGYLAGADAAKIGEHLLIVREVLNVEAPSEKALQIYLRLLIAVPADLLPLATKRLLEVYRYNNFPKPADFLTAVKAEMTERQRILGRVLLLKTRLEVAVKFYSADINR